jgi:hypothetical protein
VTSIAGRFSDALAATDPDEGTPELLPVRLAQAVAATLGVDGAGISIVDRVGRRIPLGASTEEASTAERVQFTAGEGPCVESQQSHEPVFAMPADLQRRWPSYATLLFARTPYLAVVAMPLREDLAGSGAIDVYFTDPARVTSLDVFAANAVGDMVTAALSEAAIWSNWRDDRGPEWLHAPDAERRALVWEAMGTVSLVRDVDSCTALQLLRAHACVADTDVDALAHDVVHGRFDPTDLRGQ